MEIGAYNFNIGLGKQKIHEFNASLGYRLRHCLKKTQSNECKCARKHESNLRERFNNLKAEKGHPEMRAKNKPGKQQFHVQVGWWRETQERIS